MSSSVDKPPERKKLKLSPDDESLSFTTAAAAHDGLELDLKDLVAVLVENQKAGGGASS